MCCWRVFFVVATGSVSLDDVRSACAAEVLALTHYALYMGCAGRPLDLICAPSTVPNPGAQFQTAIVFFKRRKAG